MSAAIPWSRLTATSEPTRVWAVPKSFAEHKAEADALTEGLRAKWPVPDDPRDDETCQDAAIWLAIAAYAAERLGADAQQTYTWMLDDDPETLTQVLHTVSAPDSPDLHDAWHRLFDKSDPAVHLSNLMARGFYHYEHPEVVADKVAAVRVRRGISRLFRR